MGTIKYSRQREAIRSFLLTRRDHPTADVIYENVKKEYPRISLGTVYRNLSLLTETGQINRIITGDGKDHYDGFVHPHDHFVCRCCSRVIDIDNASGLGIEKTVAKHFDGQIEGHSTIFYGVCGKCLDRETL